MLPLEPESKEALQTQETIAVSAHQEQATAQIAQKTFHESLERGDFFFSATRLHSIPIIGWLIDLILAKLTNLHQWLLSKPKVQKVAQEIIYPGHPLVTTRERRITLPSTPKNISAQPERINLGLNFEAIHQALALPVTLTGEIEQRKEARAQLIKAYEREHIVGEKFKGLLITEEQLQLLNQQPNWAENISEVADLLESMKLIVLLSDQPQPELVGKIAAIEKRVSKEHLNTRVRHGQNVEIRMAYALVSEAAVNGKFERLSKLESLVHEAQTAGDLDTFKLKVNSAKEELARIQGWFSPAIQTLFPDKAAVINTFASQVDSYKKHIEHVERNKQAVLSFVKACRAGDVDYVTKNYLNVIALLEEPLKGQNQPNLINKTLAEYRKFVEDSISKFMQAVIHNAKAADTLAELKQRVDVANGIPQQFRERDTFQNELNLLNQQIGKFEAGQKEIRAFIDACNRKDMAYISEHQAKVRKLFEVEKGLPVSLEKAIETSKNECSAAMAKLPRALAEEVSTRVSAFANGKFATDPKEMEAHLDRWLKWHQTNPDHPLGMRYLAIQPLGAGTYKNVQLVFDLAVKENGENISRYAMAHSIFWENKRFMGMIFKEDRFQIAEVERRILKMFNDHPAFMHMYSVTHSYKVKDGKAIEFQEALLLELCDGDALKLLSLLEKVPQELQKRKHVTRIDTAGQILKAIADMHSQGIIHRDLKIENIFFKSQGDKIRMKIGDFGTAVDIRSQDPNERTRRSVAAGSPATMAPEYFDAYASQFGQGISELTNEKLDAYSVGLILYEILIGPRPANLADWPSPEAQEVAKPAALMSFYDSDVQDSTKGQTVSKTLPAKTLKASPKPADSSVSTDTTGSSGSVIGPADLDRPPSLVFAENPEKPSVAFGVPQGQKSSQSGEGEKAPRILKKDLDKWFPKPAEGTVAYVVWQLLQPDPNARIDVATALQNFKAAVRAELKGSA